MSFKAEDGGTRDLGFERAAESAEEGSSSMYAEPDAEGMRPVFKTVRLLAGELPQIQRIPTYFAQVIEFSLTLRSIERRAGFQP